MPQVIAVAQAKGGCGKTTLAVCLAGYWATQGERVCVIDADPQQHAAKWIQNGNGVLTSIRLVALPRDLPREMAETNGDRVLVDLIGADADVLTLAVANADLVLIPVQDSPLDIDGALVTYRRMKQAEKARGAAIPYSNRPHPYPAADFALRGDRAAAERSGAGGGGSGAPEPGGLQGRHDDGDDTFPEPQERGGDGDRAIGAGSGSAGTGDGVMAEKKVFRQVVTAEQLVTSSSTSWHDGGPHRRRRRSPPRRHYG